MSIFDEESIILRKAIERDIEQQSKNSKNPYDYTGLSNDARARLEYDNKNRADKLIDLTMSFGPGAIQKIGTNGATVFGKFAKAVRKFIDKKNISSNAIVGVNRVSSPRNTFTVMELKTNQIDDLLNQRRANGITELSNENVNWIGLRKSSDDFSRMHEIGHQFNKRLNPDIGNNSMKLGLKNPNEVQADAFAYIKGFNRNGGEIQADLDQLMDPVIEKYGNIFKNTHVKRFPSNIKY